MKSKGKYTLPKGLSKNCLNCKPVIDWYEDKLFRYEKSVSRLGLKIKEVIKESKNAI